MGPIFCIGGQTKKNELFEVVKWTFSLLFLGYLWSVLFSHSWYLFIMPSGLEAVYNLFY